ncbi:MAG: MarC family protein [Acidobacteriaceae bacterium]|nr:MarC family protein [Acidobacteriaceae bacterium]
MNMTMRPVRRRLRQLGPGVLASLALLALAVAASAQQVTENPTEHTQGVTFSLGKVFTILFLTLGPAKLLGPFMSMTRGRDYAFRRRLAFKATVIAVIAVLFASTGGAATLHKWGVSVGALLLTAGIILFLVALKPVLEQFAPHEARIAPAPAADAPPPSPMVLAFPAIVTPYGIAVLIVLVTLPASETSVAEVLAVAIFILLLDLLAMLYADRILKTPFVAIALGIVNAVLGVLQIALGISAILLALRLLGLKT